MKKILLIIAIALIANFTSAQTTETAESKSDTQASVQKSIFGIQTGLIGLWVYNESRLTNKIALRSEIGIDLGIVDIETYLNNGTVDKVYYVILPNVSLEPRFYYNLKKRSAMGKNVENNSGNFFSVRLDYHGSKNLNGATNNFILPNQLGIYAEWGIRRVYGKHFTFETGAGLGPVLFFGNTNYIKGNDFNLDAHVRIGYSF